VHLVLSEEQRLIRESAAGLFGAAGRQRPAGGALWSKLAADGWLEMLADPASGGVDVAVFFMEAGRAGSAAPLLESALMAGRILAHAGRPEMSELVSGVRMFAFASEHLHAGGPRKAASERESWRIDGGWLAPEGGEAETFLVPTDVGVFLLDAAMPGLLVERRAGMDGGGAAHLTLSGVRVAETRRLDISADVLAGIRAAAAAAACAAAAGMMAFLVEATGIYASQRRQFGRPIASFQAIEHRLARMLIAVEEAKALASLAAIRLSADAAARDQAVSVAKARIGVLSRFVAQNAVQTHGGMGVSEAMPIGHYFRRLMAFEARLGSTRKHRAQVAGFVQATDDLGRTLIGGLAAGGGNGS